MCEADRFMFKADRFMAICYAAINNAMPCIYFVVNKYLSIEYMSEISSLYI